MNPIDPESAKACQEIAKATSQTVATVERMGRFLATVFGTPIHESIGMLSDHLKVARWERQVRLMQRCEQFIQDRNLTGDTVTVPPKLAIPIIEHGSFETNDELQDLWASLLAKAQSPSGQQQIHSSFIYILREFEPLDARILGYIYRASNEIRNSYPPDPDWDPLWDIDLDFKDICDALGIDRWQYRNAIDNLLRNNCVQLHPTIDKDKRSFGRHIGLEAEYHFVSITALGKRFVEACMYKT